MSLAGLSLCSRYSYPPNSLSLCGPQKQTYLSWYAQTGKPDKGTAEILSQFATMYPYLCFIAGENKIKDPFDEQVVAAYWIGNRLLSASEISSFAAYLSDGLLLRKKIRRAELETIMEKIPKGGLPHHSFHVMNIYRRTGHLNIPHTVETMDACIINWGKILSMGNDYLIIETQALKVEKNRLALKSHVKRRITFFGPKDSYAINLHPGNWISYHWGRFCQKLTVSDVRNLAYYTRLSISLANSGVRQ